MRNMNNQKVEPGKQHWLRTRCKIFLYCNINNYRVEFLVTLFFGRKSSNLIHFKAIEMQILNAFTIYAFLTRNII